MSENNPYGGPPPGPYGSGPQPGGPQGMPPQGVPQPGWPQGQPGYPPGGQVPNDGSGYSFGPFAPGPNVPYGAPPPGYGQPGGPPPGPEPKRWSKLPLIVGAAALVVILGIIGAVALAGRNNSETTTPSASSQNPTDPAPSSPAAAGPKASDAVDGYLKALAAGDADAALAFAATPPTNKTLLTKSALAAARKNGAVGSIQVTPVDDPLATTVDATYTVGKKSVSESFDVDNSSGSWKLTNVAADADLSFIGRGYPLKINGTKVTGTNVSLFPGSYTFSTGLKYLTYGSKNTVLVSSPVQPVATFDLAVAPSSSGKKDAVAAAKARYRTCLKSDSSKPSNCPNRWTSSAVKWRNGTIDWKQRGSDPFKKAKVTMLGDVAAVDIPIRLELSGTCTQQGRTGRCTGATLTGNAVARVSLKSSKLKTNWPS